MKFSEKNKSILQSFNSNFVRNVKKDTIIYGQNILAGSKVSGLCNGFNKIKNCKIFNTQNSEASLIGMGLGIMASNGRAIYVAKQLDFLLLGLDHIVNSYNSLLLQKRKGSFTIITYIVDTGNEGPQSRLNCLSDFASISKINCRFMLMSSDIKYNLKYLLNKSGFNLLCFSQKNINKKFDLTPNKLNTDYSVYKFGNKKKTIVLYGFSVYDFLEKKNNSKKIYNSEIFIINNPNFNDLSEIIKSVRLTKNLEIYDLSKSKNKHAYMLETKVLRTIKNVSLYTKYSNDNLDELMPNFKNQL